MTEGSQLMSEGEQQAADWKEFANKASNLFEGQTEGVYLQNRLWSAFIRGWEAGFKAGKEHELLGWQEIDVHGQVR